MKKLILFLAAILIALSSCKKNEPQEPFKLDPNATINLRPDLSAWNTPMRAPGVGETESKYLSPMEIVKQAEAIEFYNDEVAEGQRLVRSFADAQRDTLSNPPLLKMWGTDIIDQDGIYQTEFINGWDFILITEYGDTIGYIPNTVITNAREKIKAAYDNKNYEEVYKLFDEVFTFLPVTGMEWRTLKAKNKN